MDGKKLTDEQMEKIAGGAWDRSDPLLQQRFDYASHLFYESIVSGDQRGFDLFCDISKMADDPDNIYTSKDIDNVIAKYGLPLAEG